MLAILQALTFNICIFITVKHDPTTQRMITYCIIFLRPPSLPLHFAFKFPVVICTRMLIVIFLFVRFPHITLFTQSLHYRHYNFPARISLNLHLLLGYILAHHYSPLLLRPTGPVFVFSPSPFDTPLGRARAPTPPILHIRVHILIFPTAHYNRWCTRISVVVHAFRAIARLRSFVCRNS